MRSVVGLSGNFSRPSRTRLLVETIGAEVASRANWSSCCFDLVDLGPRFGATFSKDDASPEHRKVWDAVTGCDALIVGSPIYKASYTGLFKHFFDLIEPSALAGKPVIVSATGKAPQHALVIEHQFKPLFGFFGCWVAPTGLYATDTDFLADSGPAEGLKARISRAVDDLISLKP